MTASSPTIHLNGIAATVAQSQGDLRGSKLHDNVYRTIIRRLLTERPRATITETRDRKNYGLTLLERNAWTDVHHAAIPGPVSLFARGDGSLAVAEPHKRTVTILFADTEEVLCYKGGSFL